MAETAVTPAPTTGIPFHNGGGGGQNANVSPSDWNSFRMIAVMDRLFGHFYGNRRCEPAEFPNYCLSLARSIDYSNGNNEVPSRSQELPLIIKQVCQYKSDFNMQAAKMVLMISVKTACQNGWFTDGDSEELINLGNEIETSFCSVSNFSIEPSSHVTFISTVMSRFYPRMKMGHILTIFNAKSGYDAYVKDFQISKSIISSPQDKIRLFIVQTDNIETSACLVSPPKVNFLLNGKGVERRTTLSLDTGPQVPTIVNNLLKYGSNLLQAVGEFNGNYCVAVAFMSAVQNPDNNTLQDYEQHAPATVDADSEIIVGTSRISLKCPYSFKKIKTPVKGHSCKHLQCFDLDNYVDINSRRPSWRCPHCNQHVCFTDIRIDQKMVKILKETRLDVFDVLISSDGTWNAIMESDDTIKKPDDTTLNTRHDDSSKHIDVLDLTNVDDAMNDVSAAETEDKKHLPNTQDFNNQNDFWSAMFLSTFGVGSSDVRPNAPVPISVLTDSINSPVREGALDTVPSPNALQLQQYQFGNNPTVTSEYGRFPSLPRNVTRTPVAVQALPVQTPTSPHPRLSYTNVANTVSQDVPNYSMTSRGNPRQGPPISPSPLIQHSALQFRIPNTTSLSSRMVQPSATRSPSPFLRLNQQSQSELIDAANQAVQRSFEPSRIAPSYSVMSPRDQRGNPGIASQPLANGYDPTAEMDWRPAGRMRGALSGQAYAEAYNQAMNRPNNQHTQAVRPVPGVANAPAQSHGFVAGGVVPGVRAPNYSVSRPMGSDVLPGGPARMN